MEAKGPRHGFVPLLFGPLLAGLFSGCTASCSHGRVREEFTLLALGPISLLRSVAQDGAGLGVNLLAAQFALGAPLLLALAAWHRSLAWAAFAALLWWGAGLVVLAVNV